jgi:transcription elongation GreA/GreB family factor
VDHDIAVEVEDDMGARKWYMIEEGQSGIDGFRINSSHSLARALFGKRVGASVYLTEGGIDRTEGKIITIVSKYVRVH